MKTIAFLDAGTLRPTSVTNRLNLQPHQRFDWRMFIKWLGSISGELFDIHYYDALPDMPTNALGHFHTFLQQELKIQLHLGTLRSKRRTCPHCNLTFTEDIQKSVDSSLVLDMYKLSPHYDQAILVSGDGDFVNLVNTLRSECGRRVIIVGWKSVIAPQLRTAGNQIIHLEDHSQEFIGRPEEKIP